VVPTSDFCAFGPPRSGNAGTVALVPYLDGNRLGRAPRASWNVAIDLQPLHLSPNWKISGRAALAWQDDVYERPINGLRYGERKLLSARATLTGDRWHIQLWGDNLTNTRYVATAASRGGAFFPSLPRPTDLLYGERRRYGLTLGMDLSP
jgi:outer membrane receptor protein involved in Fe transport